MRKFAAATAFLAAFVFPGLVQAEESDWRIGAGLAERVQALREQAAALPGRLDLAIRSADTHAGLGRDGWSGGDRAYAFDLGTNLDPRLRLRGGITLYGAEDAVGGDGEAALTFGFRLRF